VSELDCFRIASRAEAITGPHLARAIKAIKPVVQRLNPPSKGAHRRFERDRPYIQVKRGDKNGVGTLQESNDPHFALFIWSSRID
jgi:hypothetical protein